MRFFATFLFSQLSRLHALEGHHDEVKQELETNIQVLRSQIAKYDADYSKNLEVLNSVSDNLMNLLKNVRGGGSLFLVDCNEISFVHYCSSVRSCNIFSDQWNQMLLYRLRKTMKWRINSSSQLEWMIAMLRISLD